MTAPRDIRALVEAGYDAVADRYADLERPGREWPRLRWLGKLLQSLPPGARVLDVGCGNGVPATQTIAERFDATGIDISAAQIARARRNVPAATFIRANLMEIDFEAPFAGVAAFYVIEHVPRDFHAKIFDRFHAWLEPGGHLLFTIEPDEQPGVVGTWLGKPMYFSQYDGDTTIQLARQAGFEVIERAVESQLEGEREVSYLWVLAQRST
jgi:cyclopropane fatty-acyl-phospholipid synthase-like methyltransferase